MASSMANSLLSSNFFGSQIFVSPPTPKTTKISHLYPKRKFFPVPQSILNKKPNSDKVKYFPSEAALAALLFSSITPQAFALDNTTPTAPPPSVVQAETPKPNPLNPSPFRKI